MLDKLERKIGRYAIPGLIKYLIAGYVVGYLMSVITPDMLGFITLEPYMIINKFQVWRLITWVLYPPSRLGIFTIIMLFFYWSLGNSLEQIWGTFRFNLYIFGGIFFTVIGSFIMYFILMQAETIDPTWGIVLAKDSLTGTLFPSMGAYFNTYYINMSIFLAFALSIPDMQVLLYFIIPVKMKWLAILYAVLVGMEFFGGNAFTKISIICSLLNFLLFFLSTRKFSGFSRGRSGFGGYSSYNSRGQRTSYGFRGFSKRNTGNPGQNRDYDPYQGARNYRQQQYNENPYGSGNGTASKSNAISRHRCCVCGRTEITDPGLEFRFCSKCNGNYEYCNEHLFTHEHVK